MYSEKQGIAPGFSNEGADMKKASNVILLGELGYISIFTPIFVIPTSFGTSAKETVEISFY
jgi:hypothetical protein